MTHIDINEARKSTDPAMIPVLCNVVDRLAAQLDGMQNHLVKAYSDGFSSGQDHGNLDYKYPPHDVALIIYKSTRPDLFPPASDKEKALMKRWIECRRYDELTDESIWTLAP